jgi:hypothetical protein
LNDIDAIAEARIANLAREVTGLPLLGMTLAGDGAWSSRVWHGIGKNVTAAPCESVRAVGDGLFITYNGQLVPLPRANNRQVRTVHTWGEETQARIARLRVAIAGVGSVGMAVAEILARTGIEHIGVFDFDTVEFVNLDRLSGAGLVDALLKRSKAYVARRLMIEAATAANPQHEFHELSICEPEGFMRLLDFDIIFSCVDRPWPRHVLNTLAYADLIPVIEGGMSAFQNPDHTLRNAYWSSTVVRSGRPCLACLGQYDPALVQVERDGSLDDPSYIANLPADATVRRRQNVAALSVSVTAAMMQQFVSFLARPSGFPDPGPMRFDSRTHKAKESQVKCSIDCPYSANLGIGDRRLDPTGRHQAAELARSLRDSVTVRVRIGRVLDDIAMNIRRSLKFITPSRA